MGFIKVVIADDHQLFRDGVLALLARDEDIDVVGEAATGEEALHIIALREPHVALIDLGLPERHGLDVIKLLRKRHPQVKCIALTMHDEGQYVVQAVRNGAYGYLLKNADEAELKQAIHTVFTGKKYFNAYISELMIQNMAVQGSQVKKLSQREQEVLQRVAEGKITKEIADELSVSTRTVETHRVNIMKKLDVRNTAELIKKAAQLKLI
ncbi:DNA-binding response regulator, NarL/FixJ family, contains REC and HTH domains [Catalinimonas alkaloidigena]|uniref:DNA-binding response regulator, NarL/FixJ family, contains REC and HTH domains n=1 Tax=Catalinimonas alkaloidigena TaxID=1075417 RepID=A0A1G9T7L2_9BACT|nr:response regulator transcription factor [Catalinimonas alkaloidigena]SDM43612.1 DNA-binding response regulator, NarL/FixJ family, contains REC and HTH domains [Catalinimonas alkaloidigena]